jgi:hypothetical protein
MKNISEMNVTNIQFFDQGDGAYSANIAFDECVVVQLSGNDEEAHPVSVPSAEECFYDEPLAQEHAYQNWCIDEVERRLDDLGIENNYHFLHDNADLHM